MGCDGLRWHVSPLWTQSAVRRAPRLVCLVVCMPVTGWTGLGRTYVVSAHKTGDACRTCAAESAAEPYM